MSPCCVACPNPGYFEGNHLGIEQRHHPANWADKPDPALAGPLHVLREVNAGNNPGQFLAESFFCPLSVHVLMKRIPFTFRVLNRRELVDRYALLARETLG